MNFKQKSLSFPDLSDDQMISDYNYEEIAKIERETFMKKLHTFFLRDKYWPKINMETNERKIKIYQELKHFEKSHRDWVYSHLDYGCPTFYSILAVDINVDMMRLHENYLFKQQNSCIPSDIIEEAYKTIKKIELRKKYNRFLKMFRNYYTLLDEDERSELDKKHSEWQYNERAKTMLSLILERQKNWEVLYLIGLNLYSISKIEPNYRFSDVVSLYKKYLKSRAKHSKIQVLITKLFLNPFVFKEYKVFLSIYTSIFFDDRKDQYITKLQKYWHKFNFTINDFSDILLSNEPLREKLTTYQSIISRNYNWLEYLPPHNKTLYEVLNIDIMNSNYSNSVESTTRNSQFRDLLFKKYKIVQKTSETNLAYSILKNPQTRTDYDWMLKNNLVLMKILFLLQLEDLDPKYLDQIIKGKKSIEDILIQYQFLR